MDKIINGNLNANVESKTRGWFIGHFMEKDSFFKNEDFEVRWGVHPKGDKKSQIAANKTAKTLSILIKGKFALKFPKDNKEIILAKQGDFAFWDAKVFHTSEALEDSIILTIRWPSVSNDQFPLP